MTIVAERPSIVAGGAVYFFGLGIQTVRVLVVQIVNRTLQIVTGMAIEAEYFRAMA